MTWETTARVGSPFLSVVNPSGDAEMGTWMIAERVIWPNHAKLIAAAPELLEALKAAREELRLIRMKDTDAIYNPGLRVLMDIALDKAGHLND